MFGLDDILSGPMSLADNIITGGAGNDAQKYAQQGRDYLGAANVESGPSAFATTDPATRAAQLEALGQLQAKYHAGGLDAIDRARLGDIQAGVNQTAATGRAAVQQDAQRRGLYNSGNALVSAQVAGQGAATAGAQQARDAAALAEQARTGAITNAAGVAGGIRGQDYQKASGLDAISRFNAAQRLQRAQSIAGVGVQQGQLAEEDAARRTRQAGAIAQGAGLGAGKGGGGGGSPTPWNPTQDTLGLQDWGT